MAERSTTTRGEDAASEDVALDSRQDYRRLSHARIKSPDRDRELLSRHPRSPRHKAGTSSHPPPHFPPSSNHSPSPPHHHRRSKHHERGRHPTSRARDEDQDQDLHHSSPAARRTKPSTERHSQHQHHHHHRHGTHHEHKRHRSRSHSPTRHHRSHHKRGSPASPAPNLHPDSKDPRARSPRPAHLDASVAARRPYSPHSHSHRRHRSRSIESRYSTESRRGEHRRPQFEERLHEGGEEVTHRGYSSREGHRRRDSRSPPPIQEYRSGRGAHSGHSHRRWEEAEYTHSSRRGYPSSEEGSQRHGRRLPRSPIREARHSSRESLARSAAQDDLRRPGPHSPSRERSQRSRYSELDDESEMYPRGGGYHSGYGYGPPSHPSYNRSGYSQPPYPPHAGSPPGHGYSSQQPPYPYHGGHHQQSHPPQYQPQPGLSYGASPNRAPYPPRDGPPRGGMRGGPSGRGGRGHFANMSWTPSEGTKGGHIVQPGEKPRGRDDPPSSTSLSKQPLSAGSPQDDDNPFRPPADLRTEDEDQANKRKAASPPPSRTPQAQPARESEKETGRNKISFSIKGRATHPATDRSGPTKSDTSPLMDRKLPVLESPLAPAPTPPPAAAPVPKSRLYVGNTRVGAPPPPPRRQSPPPVRKEIVRKKRIKVKPQLSEEHAQSESVYFRKTGNESVVGSGTYGKVYKGVHVYTGRMVALKKIRMEGERDGFPVTAIREIKLLQSLNHVNIVALQEVMVERNDCFMVFEYLEHDLTGLINHPTFTLTAAHKKHLAKQFFESLEYLHHRGVLHRDIKAANILISKTGDLKLADFGLARFYQKRQKQEYTNRVITIWYRSPELLLGETQYGPSVDIWSAACVLVEIFTRHAIFPGDGSEINQLDKIYSVLGTPSRNEWPGIVELQWYELLRPASRQTSTFADKYRERVSPEAFELLQAMFQYDPANRPTAADVLEHPYFTTEEPKPERPIELAELEGDWHEFESKALRKEKERAEREARRREREKEGEKRKAEGDAGAESKRVKTEAAGPA